MLYMETVIPIAWCLSGAYPVAGGGGHVQASPELIRLALRMLIRVLIREGLAARSAAAVT